MLSMYFRIFALVICCASLAAVPAAASASTADDPQRAVAGELVVTYRAGSTDAQQRGAQQRVGATSSRRIATRSDTSGAVALLTQRSELQNSRAIAALATHPAVKSAEPNWIYTSQATSVDPSFTNGSLWGMYGDASTPRNIFGSQAAEAWARGSVGSRTTYVGIIDEGIQVTHPDLAGNAWVNPFDPVDGVDNDRNGYVDDRNGWDFAAGDSSVYDGGTQGKVDSHGTHVAGTIGASANQAGVVGVNWNVTYISGKFLGRNGGTTANAIRALDYFTDLKTRHNLNIVATNNSWGGGGYSQALLDAINRSGNAGILFVVAAGNGGRDGVGDNNDTTATYPANYTCTANGTYDCVLSVAAIDSTGAKAGFSNFGAQTVDIGAPGVSILSTLPFNKYGSYSGTSMATPHVAGAAALWASSHPGASAAAIRAAIVSSALPTSSLAARTVTGGRLDTSEF